MSWAKKNRQKRKRDADAVAFAVRWSALNQQPDLSQGAPTQDTPPRFIAWVKCPVHRGPPSLQVWTGKFLGYHLMLTRDLNREGVRVSFRRLQIRRAPYERLDIYPTLEEAVEKATFDFAQRILELEHENPSVENARENRFPTFRR